MDEEMIKKILSEMELPVSVEIPNSILISKDMVRKGLALIGAYVVLRGSVRFYAKVLIANEVNKQLKANGDGVS